MQKVAWNAKNNYDFHVFTLSMSSFDPSDGALDAWAMHLHHLTNFLSATLRLIGGEVRLHAEEGEKSNDSPCLLNY